MSKKIFLIVLVFSLFTTPILAAGREQDRQVSGPREERRVASAPREASYLRRNALYPPLSAEERNRLISQLQNMSPAERCTYVTKAANKRVNAYQNSFTKHLQVYQDITDLINDNMDKIVAAGLDQGLISQDLTTLNSMIDKLTELQNQLVKKILLIPDAVCTSKPKIADIKQKVQDASSALQDVRKQTNDIKDFIRNKLAEPLKVIKKASEPVSSPQD